MGLPPLPVGSARGLSQFSSDENGTVPLDAAVAAAINSGVRRLTGVRVHAGRHLKTFKHGVTRFRITLECYEAEYLSTVGGKGKPGTAELRWLRPSELEAYPLSTTGRKLARLVQRRKEEG